VTLDSSNGSSAFIVRNSASNELARVQSNGNVGIGTTTPVSKLHIAGADMNNALLLENTSANPGRNYILFKTLGTEQGYIGLGGGATDHMSFAAYGASNNIFLETGGFVRMTVLPSGNIGIGTTTPYTTLTVGSTDATAKITAGGPNTTLTIAAAGSDGRIYFNAGGVANGNYSTSTRLTILPEGRVGIGTTTPADLLQVGNLMFGGNSGRDISSTSGYDINYKATGASSHHFYANGTEKFTIDKTGNIGIGINSPNNKLQIGSTTYSENTLAMGNGTQNFAIDISWSTIPTFYSDNNFSFMASGGGNGNVGIGTTTPTHPLQMGSGAHVTTAGNWTNASDARLKTNIVNTNYGLQTVMQLRPVNYTMVKGGEAQVGFLAQEVQKIVPEVVSGTEGDMSKGETLGLSYGNLVPVLTKAIQEQQALIEKLQAENAAMKAKVETVDNLKADLEALKSAVYGTAKNQ
jgi:hypothetical protein